MARSKPGVLNYGSTGIGTPLSFAMELFKYAAGLEIQAVSYRGDALIMAALSTGEVHVTVVSMAIAKPFIESGTIRAIAVTEPRRAVAMPELPTIGEALPEFGSIISWQAFFAPAKTPATVLELLQRETALALRSPEVVERLANWSYVPVGNLPEVFEAYFRIEVAKYAKIAKDARIRQVD